MNAAIDAKAADMSVADYRKLIQKPLTTVRGSKDRLGEWVPLGCRPAPVDSRGPAHFAYLCASCEGHASGVIVPSPRLKA